jgi:hypothetical protein
VGQFKVAEVSQAKCSSPTADESLIGLIENLNLFRSRGKLNISLDVDARGERECVRERSRMSSADDGFEALLEPFYNGKKLTDPISTKEDKFQLLPAFLKVKGEHAYLPIGIGFCASDLC